MDVYKKNNDARFFDQLKHINHVSSEASSLPDIPMLEDFRKKVNIVKQLYNQFIATEDIHLIAPEIKDLHDQIDSYVEGACVKFQTEANAFIAESRTEMRKMEEYGKLTDSQKAEVNAKIDGMDLDYRSPSLESLREMVNTYTQYYLPSGRVEYMKVIIRRMAKENEPPVQTHQASPTGPDNPTKENEAGEQIVRPCHMHLKRRLTSKSDLETVIAELRRYLDNISEETPIEFSINE